MEHIFKLSSHLGILLIILLSACAKKSSTPDQAINEAHAVYATMDTRYKKVLQYHAMNAECIQELRILGVHRERTWFEFFYDILFLNWFAWNSRKSTPIFRMEAILKNDIQEINDVLVGLRKFGLESHFSYEKLTTLSNKLTVIKEQLPVQKDYIDENNTRITHSMLTTLQFKK